MAGLLKKNSRCRPRSSREEIECCERRKACKKKEQVQGEKKGGAHTHTKKQLMLRLLLSSVQFRISYLSSFWCCTSRKEPVEVLPASLNRLQPPTQPTTHS